MTENQMVQRIDTRVRLARAVIENLRPADLAAELENGGPVLVDVRGVDELGSGTIVGAINVPRGVIELAADVNGLARRGALDPASRIVVYSNTGSRSALAAQALDALGYRDIAHLEGGLAAWIADGRPVTTVPVIDEPPDRARCGVA